MTEEQVRAACCNRVWSMVVESFLKGNSGRNCKHKLIRKMVSSFLEIARDKYGFHAALTALTTAANDGHVETHAQLSRIIKQNRDHVARSEWGLKLLKKIAQKAREDEDNAADNPAAVPLTVESLLQPAEKTKKSKKKQKKRDKKRAREEEEEAVAATRGGEGGEDQK